MTAVPQIPLAAEVERALSPLLSDENPISTWEITRAIARLNDAIAGGQMARAYERGGWEGAELRPAADWMQALAVLFDPEKVTELHDRLVILGLAAVDPALRQHLTALGIYDLLLKELGEPLEAFVRRPPDRTAEPNAAQQAAQTAAPPVEPAPAPTPEFDEALGQAAATARHTKPPHPADSVILLAVLLLGGARAAAPPRRQPARKAAPRQSAAPSPSRETPAAAVAREMLRQRYPNYSLADLLSPPPYLRAVTEAAPSAEPTPSISIPILLGMEEDYGITHLDADEGPFAQPSALEGELAAVERAARQFAAQASPNRGADADHLLAVLLAPRLAAPVPSVQRRLVHLGYDLPALRRACLQAAREAHPDDNLPAWEAALLARDHLPPIAGYISDYVHVYDDVIDRLNIEDEVINIASVLTFKEVSPPLALGLFGDWGSGKTFFMNKLRQAIATSATYYCEQEKIEKKPARWCSRVVQIFFNAWNYSDTNLWAGLVTRIYEALYDELNDADAKDRAYKEEIEKRVATAKGAVSEAQAQKALAGERVRKAHADLIAAQEERQKKETSLRGLINDLAGLLQKKNRDDLARAANALGRPQAAQFFDDLQSLHDALQSFSGRTSALLLHSFRSHWTLLILALCVIALPLLVTLLIENAMPFLGQVGQRVAEISVFLSGLIAAAKFQIDRGMTWVKQIETAFAEAQEVRQKRLAGQDGRVKQARDDLVLAESQEQAAAANLQAAQLELQRLESQLAELRPERRFFHLIEERAQSAAYRQYLGIISLIRTDFEKISDLLMDMAKTGDNRDFANEPPPIQRIILYIDDLDRCRPERVVEVLEAVHLLLAFPLFVVVVGVDPRWLHQSLLRHYSPTLSDQAAADGRTLPGFATPQDYLEKIFQIPYALKPVEESGYKNLVLDLLGPGGAGPAGGAVTGGNGAGPASGTAQPAPASGPAASTAGAPADTSAAAPAGQPAAQLPSESRRAQVNISHFTPLTHDQLQFTEAEKQAMLLLWPLFRTPRTVKRYVNLYRLLRASLRTQREVTLFEGGDTWVGEYRTAMLLLAVVTSYPNHAGDFLKELDEWIQAEVKKRPSAGSGPAAPLPLCWEDFIAAQRAKRAALNQPSTAPAPAPAPPVSPAQVNDTITEEVRGEMTWERLLDGLEQVCRAENFDPPSVEVLRRWAVRVSRYSFSIG